MNGGAQARGVFRVPIAIAGQSRWVVEIGSVHARPYRVADLPRPFFFSAVVTPRGRWVDTPWGSRAEYFDRVLDEYEDRLAVVVATADLRYAEELH